VRANAFATGSKRGSASSVTTVFALALLAIRRRLGKPAPNRKPGLGPASDTMFRRCPRE
jgi:hypothetical protein